MHGYVIMVHDHGAHWINVVNDDTSGSMLERA